MLFNMFNLGFLTSRKKKSKILKSSWNFKKLEMIYTFQLRSCGKLIHFPENIITKCLNSQIHKL